MKPFASRNSDKQQISEKHAEVCVTGAGIICAAGGCADEVMRNMLEGRRNPLRKPSLFSSDLNKPVFECDSSLLNPDFLPENRTLALLVKALDEALADAELTPELLGKRRVGICIGTTVACTLNDLEFYSELRNGSVTDISALYRYLCSDLSLVTAGMLGLDDALVLDAANACSSGTNAVSVGVSWIQSGECDIVIAGGADELNEVPYCGFNSLQVMSGEFCLPFDQRRDGLNLGEGAGVLILESRESAEQRSISPSVLISASAEGSDAYHLTGPHPQGAGLKSALLKLFEDFDADNVQIDYINAHGTATINNDRTESVVFREIFGDSVKYSSTKYFTGHTLAAAGAVEAVVCVLGMRGGAFPGMPELVPADDVPVAPQTGNIKYSGGAVISTSMAFGGSCAALMFSPADDNSHKSGKISRRAFSFSFDMKESALRNVNKIAELKQSVFVPGIECAAAGIITPAGIGREAFGELLADGGKSRKALSAGAVRGLTVPENIFSTAGFKRMRRRADKLSLAAFAAASDAVKNYGEKPAPDRTALISLTTFGAYVTTFRFLDGLIDFGFDAPSPTQFSNSVHNASAFYISRELDIKGPTLSLNGFSNLFAEGVRLASVYLNRRKYDNVILVAGDEICLEFLQIVNFLKERFAGMNFEIPAFWIETSSAFIFRKGEGVFLPDEEKIGRFEEVCGFSMIREALPFAASVFEFDS